MLAASRNALSTFGLATHLPPFRSVSTSTIGRDKFRVLVVGGGMIAFFGLYNFLFMILHLDRHWWLVCRSSDL